MYDDLKAWDTLEKKGCFFERGTFLFTQQETAKIDNTCREVQKTISLLGVPQLFSFIVNYLKEFLLHQVLCNFKCTPLQDGLIEYNCTVSEFIYCPMDFSWFPFDAQICVQTINSFLEETEGKKRLKWKNHFMQSDHEDARRHS